MLFLCFGPFNIFAEKGYPFGLSVFLYYFKGFLVILIGLIIFLLSSDDKVEKLGF